MQDNTKLKRQTEEKSDINQKEDYKLLYKSSSKWLVFKDLFKNNNGSSILDIKIVRCKDVKEMKEKVINLINVGVAPISIIKYILYRKNVAEASCDEIIGSKDDKIIHFVEKLSKRDETIFALNIKIGQEDIRYDPVEDMNYLFVI